MNIVEASAWILMYSKHQDCVSASAWYVYCKWHRTWECMIAVTDSYHISIFPNQSWNLKTSCNGIIDNLKSCHRRFHRHKMQEIGQEGCEPVRAVIRFVQAGRTEKPIQFVGSWIDRLGPELSATWARSRLTSLLRAVRHYWGRDGCGTAQSHDRWTMRYRTDELTRKIVDIRWRSSILNMRNQLSFYQCVM